MIDPNIQALLAVAKCYGEVAGLSETTVSLRLFNDSARLSRIREEGIDIGVIRLRAAIQWFSDRWPEGRDWPYEIARPTPQRETDRAQRSPASRPQRAKPRRRASARKGD